ncbi:hypothetical protein VaNZ11_012676, partial [Volvox africanus]
VDGIDRGGGGGGSGGLMRAFAAEAVPECAELEPAAVAVMYDRHGGPMMTPWGHTGSAWPAASNVMYQAYGNAHAVPYQGNMQYGYWTGLTTGAGAPLEVAASEMYDNSRGMSVTSHTHIAAPVDAAAVDADACVLPQDAAAAVRQAAAAQLFHAPGPVVPVVRTTAADADGTRAGGGGANAVSTPPPPLPPLDVQGSEIQPLTRSPQHRSSHSRPRQRWCEVDTPADSFLDAVPGPAAAEGVSPATTRNHQLISSSDTTVLGDSRSTSGGSGGGTVVAGPTSLSSRLLSRPGSNSLQSTASAVAATATVSGAYGGAISPQATASLLTRSTSVDRAGSHSLVATTAFRDAMVSTAEAVAAAAAVVSERAGTMLSAMEMVDGGGKVTAGGDMTAQRPATSNTKSEYGMKSPFQRHHNRLLRSSSAAGVLLSVLRADRRMWPWSPDPEPGPIDHHHDHQQQTDCADSAAAVSPFTLSPSRSLGSRRRPRRVVQPLGQAVSVGGASAAAVATATAVPLLRATASVSVSASAARSIRDPSWQEQVIEALAPAAPGPGCSSTDSPPSPLVGVPHTGSSLSSPALLTAAAATGQPRALTGGGGSSGTMTAQASRLQIANPFIDAGGVEAAKAAAGVAATAADTRGSGGSNAPIPTAANSPRPRMVRKSPFMVKPSGVRRSESPGTGATDSASNLTPSRTEISPSGGGGGVGAIPQLPPTAGTAGGSFTSAGASIILQQAFSEPVRPPRVSMVVAAAPPHPADVLAGGGGGGGSGSATVTLPSPSAKPGLGRLLVGSLSNLFRVDSLTGGLQRSPSPPPAALNPSGSSLTGMVDRLPANRTSAIQLVDVRHGGSPTPSGASAQRTSNTGSAAGTTVAGITARGGCSRGGTATPAATDLCTALSELTADFESRLNENQLVIQQVLGSGAFGTVYKALWKGLQVAVKTMTLTADAVTQGRHAALMEAALSKSIFHPNVVTTYTCDLKPMHVDSQRGGAMTGLQILNETEVIQEWRLYIVQEFCDGGSLRHAIEARSFLNSATGSPQMEWVLQMAREIAGGLQYLHEHNIIHGDLNPANVLLRRDDSSVLGYAAKIADFGLSVHMQGEQSHVSNTKRGTPFYTAPEVTHAGNLTRFADVFSYGVVLWELYCSRSCWMYGPQGRLIHQRGFPHLPPSCPRAYATLVSNCMQPAHKQRPSFKQIGVLLSSMLREYEYAARSAAAVVASPSWYRSQAPSPPQQLHLQGLMLNAQPYILQSPQYERHSKERASSPVLPSPQLNQPLQSPQLLGRQQPVGQALQPFQKASGRSSMGSSSGGARSSTPTSTCSSPLPPSQQQQLPQQVGLRSGLNLAVNLAATAPICEGVNRRASWEPGMEAAAAAADRTQGPGGAGFVSTGGVATGGTPRTRSDTDEPALATAIVSALGTSLSLP